MNFPCGHNRCLEKLKKDYLQFTLVVFLRCPSGLTKIRGTEQSGNLRAVSKSIARSFLQEKDNKVLRTFLFAPMLMIYCYF